MSMNWVILASTVPSYVTETIYKGEIHFYDTELNFNGDKYIGRSINKVYFICLRVKG